MKKFEGFFNGINLGGWISQCLAYTKEHYDSFITEEDIKRIADSRINGRKSAFYDANKVF